MTNKSQIFFNNNLLSVNHRGMQRYFKKIIDGAVARLGHNAIVCSPVRRDYGAATYIPSIQFKGNQPLRLNQLIVNSVILWKKPALLFNAFYNHVRTSAPQVFTVYDMIPELFPQYYDPGHSGNQRFMSEKKRCLEQAALVFSISKSTAQDAINHYPNLDPQKICVTHLGVDPFFFETPVKQPLQPQKPYFLFVGHRMLHKNFLRLLIAFEQSGLASEFDLQVISPGGFVSAELDEIKKRHLENSVHILSDADDLTLRQAYAQSVAFVYPSVYEGFGLPILEAMASGTLVVTSNVSSMPEIGGEVAFYFDPYNPESIADCLIQIAQLTNQERQNKIAEGRARAGTFTWERCQQLTLDALTQFR